MTIAFVLATLGGAKIVAAFVAWAVWSLKGTLLLFLAWVVNRVLCRGSASVRHLVWASALAGMLVGPFVSRVVPVIRVPLRSDAMKLWPAMRDAVPAAVDRGIGTPGGGARLSAVASEATTPVSTSTIVAPISDVELQSSNSVPPGLRGDALLAAMWLIGVALLLLRSLTGTLQLSVWTRRAKSVDDAEWLSMTQRLAFGMEIGRPVTLLRSHLACVPMTWGVVYPRILLPADADSWTPSRRTIVLLHELAHIKRFDTLTQLLAQLSTALFWFNPAVWYAARAMRREREHACDDFVLDAGARASDYASDLLQIARPLVSGGAPAAAALAMARRSELEGRLLAILDPRIDRRPVSRTRLALASVALVGLAIPLAALAPAADALATVAKTATPSREPTIESRPTIPETTAPATTALRTSKLSVARPTSAQPEPHSANEAEQPSLPAVLPPPMAVLEHPAQTWAPIASPIFRVKRTPPDLETLIAVTRAAAKLTSDNDKAELLLTVARHYVRDDELRSAYLDAVLSIRSDYDRSRVLEPLLMKDTLPLSAVEKLARIASSMTSDGDKGRLVVHIATTHPAITGGLRSALISTAGTLRSDFERRRAIAAIARRGDLSADDAIRLIGAARTMTSSTEKANALLAIAASRPLDSTEVRRAYFAAAETISSAYDYRRAIVRVIE